MSAAASKADLERLLEAVSSRREPVEVVSPWGSVVLLPGALFNRWLPLIRQTILLGDDRVTAADAAWNTQRWDSLTELRDADTGTWVVNTSREILIFDLAVRKVSRRPLLEGPAMMEVTQLDGIELLRVGTVGSWMTRPEPPMSHKRATSGTVLGITRIDNGTESTSDAPEPAWWEPSATSEPRAVSAITPCHVSFADARRAWEDLLANVASRNERASVLTPLGVVLLVAREYFDSMVFFARTIDEIMTLPDEPPDAARLRDVGERVVELRDSDTGVWLVTTDDGTLVLDLQSRTIYPVTLEDEELLLTVFRSSLQRVSFCRVGHPASFEIAPGPTPLWERETIGRVVSIVRLDDWLV